MYNSVAGREFGHSLFLEKSCRWPAESLDIVYFLGNRSSLLASGRPNVCTPFSEKKVL